ncbi:MAG: DUF6089 family protein [Reichenbachiella sp.]
MIRISSFPLLLLLFLYSFDGHCQKTEIGFGIGSNSYSGDMYRGYNFLNQRPAIQAFYRSNYDKDVSFKLSLLYGGLKGNDQKPFDALGSARNQSFKRTFLEGSAIVEFHFLDYKHNRTTIRWSPYVFGGVGVVRFFNLDPVVDDFNSFQPVIPFGVGFKHLVGKQLSVGLEFGARKTFFDQLDGVSDGDVFEKTDFQFGNPEDKDWYYHVGLSISYIIYKIPCTYKYEPNKSMRR